MAFADDLRNFLENRLRAYDPSIDVSENSPAQVEIITPILKRFEEDPFSIDISLFIKDRLTQEYPELATDGGSELEDMLIKPLQLLLEPFKREIELIKLTKSTQNASLMSDDEADALGANWFSDREEGDFSGGPVRLFFNQPSTTRVSTDKRCYTADGRSYFPIQSYFITSQTMLYNRQGNRYFLDIRVQAETQGELYNIDEGEIIGIEEVPGVVEVTNPSPFVSGIPRETNEEFLTATEQGLSERSLAVPRGILSQIRNLFDSVRAVQVVGAGEEGMNRDILTGTGEGFLHLVGVGIAYGDWLLTSSVYYRDDGVENSIMPQAGDTIRLHIGTAPSTSTMFEVVIRSVMTTQSNTYLFLLSESPFDPASVENVTWALFKPGYITISNAPGGISSEITVPDDEVHLGGHTDVFLRPSEDAEIRTTLESVTDDDPLVAIVDLEVPTAGQNLVRSNSSDFVDKGVAAGDVLVIETGTGYAGTYRILEVDSSTDLRLDSIFLSSTSSALRARVVRNIRVDLIEPKIPKLPFTPGPVSDLITTVGSNEFRFESINIQEFGAVPGDIINILQGPDAGEFTILGFNSISGSVIVDSQATATNSNLSYEIYTLQRGLSRPLVRLKSIEALDSTGQGTGITVPYGDSVDIRPLSNFEGAGLESRTYDPLAIIFPDFIAEWGSGGLAQDPVSLGSINQTTDASYSLLLKQIGENGVIRKIVHHASNQIETTEIEVPSFLFNGRRDTLLALTARADNDFPISAGINRTSDLAEAKIGDAIIIHDGPNQGKYIISDHVILDLWGKTDQGHRKVALIQVDPPFKVDPIRTALNLINEENGSALWTASDLFGFLQYAADWDNPSGFYSTFITALRSALTSLGVSFATDSDLKTFFNPLCKVSYSVGPAAKGTFRCYFLEPVSTELYFGNSPTTFISATGTKSFRLDPTISPAQILPESLETTSPSLWNRNLGVEIAQGDFAFLTSGSSFANRGIRVGDIIEYHLPINDLPSRRSMTSSWLCITQSGSNVVRLIIPQSNATQERFYGGADNYTLLEAGQLFFIDSGPDIGSYTIVKVLNQNWATNPPLLEVQLDQTLTHTTQNFPVLSTSDTQTPQADFSSNLRSYLLSDPITFPVNLNGSYLEIDYSSDGGSTWGTVQHQFVAANPYSNMASIVADINGDSGFIAQVSPSVFGSRLGLSTSAVTGPRTRIRVSTSPSSPSAHATLQLVNGAIGRGFRGGATLPGTKRIYGSGLNQVQAGDYITIYAVYGTNIITTGNDEAIIGSYEVAAVGTDITAAPFWGSPGVFVELSRAQNFPSGEPIEVRWVRHGEPETAPADTSGGGKEISDQFVRFRLYEAVSRETEVINIPWSENPHPLLETSERQIELSEPLVDIGANQRNYAHLSPFRVLRPGVLRISSTEMAEQREGALYFIDIPVVGYGPGSEMNVTPEEGFVISGERKIDGYTLEVDDENFVFSMKEEIHLVLPNSVLPVGSTADLNNEFSLAGQNLEVTYNNAPVVEDIQTFLDSPLDRTTNANMLARHFLPAYVMLDTTYSGGSSEEEVSSDVISYINNIEPDVNEIRTDLVEDTIKRRGANTVELPITLIALFHGTDRRIRGMRSETSIGIGDTPFFKGTFKQTYFISGPNTSKTSPRPPGEQVFLRRT